MGMVAKRIPLKRKVCKYTLLFINLCGLFPFQKDVYLLKYLWYIFLLSGYSYVIGSSIAALVLGIAHDFVEITSILNSINTTLTCILTNLTTYKKRKELIHLLTAMDKNFYTYGIEEISAEEERVATERTIKYSKVVWISGVLHTVTVCAQIMAVTFDKDLLESPFTLLYVAWGPLELNSLRNFYVLYVLQVISTIPHFTALIGGIGLVTNILMETRFQFDRLEHMLNDISTKCLTNRTIAWWNGEKNIIFDLSPRSIEPISKKQLIEFHIRLKKCIRHYQCLIRDLKEYGSWFQWLYSFNLVYGGITYGLLFYTAFSDKLTMAATVKYIGVLIGLTVQLFTCCAAGEFTSKWNQDFSNSVYNLPWYKLPPRSRKDVFILLNQTQKPLQFKGIKIYTASLLIFSSMMRFSYSYFNFLRTYESYKVHKH